MNALSTHEITQLLVAWNNGDRMALEQLTPLVHTELHRIAKLLAANTPCKPKPRQTSGG